MNFLGVKPETKKRILIIGANLAAIGFAEPLQTFRDWYLTLRIHMMWGYLEPGRMVANSKSIKQKRPSDWR